MAISAQINGNMTITDGSTGAIALTKVFSGLITTGTTFTETSSISVGTSPVTITLPIAVVNFLYIKNTHTTQVLTVTWTPNGQSSAIVLVLRAGSAILFSETSAGQGIAALSLTGGGAATTAEYILAG